jgi:hypothetical protein
MRSGSISACYVSFFWSNPTNRACQLQSRPCGGDNRCVARKSQQEGAGSNALPARGPFLPGAMVIVTLGNPRDKFWGVILALTPEGLSLSGVELASFEDFVVMVKDGEPFSSAVVFFPMHRVERIELDLPDGNLPSLSQRFSAKTGREPAALLAPPSLSEESKRRGSPRIAANPTAGPA